MKKRYRLSGLLILMLLLVCTTTGCKVSKKKVESSSYYQKLEKKYEKLKKENKKLQEASDSQEQVSAAEERAEKYLTKIARDTLVNIEVGYADDMDESVYVPYEDMFDLATRIADRADRSTKYTPEELEQEYSPMYEYILYDEDNAIYEITVYGSDYVIFSDLPKYVYYVPDASALGDAFLLYRVDYPASSLFHRMADSPLMIDSKERYYENNVVVKTANYIDQMKKKKTNSDKAEAYWKKKAGISEEEEADSSSYMPKSWTYKYFHHGNTLTLTLYDHFIRIVNVDGEDSWYRVSKKDIKGIMSILKEERDARAEAEASDSTEQATDSQDQSTTEESHTKEIEEESDLSSEAE